MKMPKLVTEQLFQQELLSVIAEDKLNSFLLGEKSKLPFALFEELVIKLQKEIPEIFTLIDRLLVEITVNPSRFEEGDPYIELVAPDSHSSLNDPFRLFTYVLNLSKKAVRSRRILIEASTSRRLRLQQLTRRLSGIGGIILPTLRLLIFII